MCLPWADTQVRPYRRIPGGEGLGDCFAALAMTPCERVFPLVVPILKIAPTVSPDHNIKKFAWDHDHLADGLSFDKFLDV